MMDTVLASASPVYGLYCNLITASEYQKQKLLFGHVSFLKGGESVKTKLSKEVFMKLIQTEGYVILETEDTAERFRSSRIGGRTPGFPIRTYWMLIDSQEAKFAATAGNLVEFIQRLGIPSRRRDDHDRELIILIRDINDTYINSVTPALSFPAEVRNGKPIGGLRTLFYGYVHFKMVVPEHITTPKHRVLSPEEEAKTLAALRLQKSQLPRMRHTDAMAEWIGAEIDMVVEIQKRDDTTLYRTQYAVVV